jgi:hypothetical protein
VDATGIDFYACEDADSLFQAMQKAGLKPQRRATRANDDSLIGDFLNQTAFNTLSV